MAIVKYLSRKKKQQVPRSAEAASAPERRVSLDYPQAGETIISSRYTFRIAASAEMERVEILIQNGDWQACRPAEGYWWYDWSGYSDGEYHAAARACSRDGRTFIAEPRLFLVRMA